MSLRDLYQEIIIDHSKAPRNFGQLTAANHLQVGHNPLCGDKLLLTVQADENKITDIAFEGTGCAICMASASLMTETIKGKSLQDFSTLFDGFHALLTGGESKTDLGKLAVFAGVAEFPIRVKCATLAWHTLKAALHQQNICVSTE